MKLVHALSLAAVLASPASAQAGPPAGWPKDWPAHSPALIEKGKAVYKVNCEMCHGEKGDGKGPAGIALQPPPRTYANVKEYKNGAKPADIFKTISEGLAGTAMASFAHIPEEDRKALAAFVVTFQKGTGSKPKKK